jgi:hypothetical protein
MSNYIYPAPGNVAAQVTLSLKFLGDTIGLDVPALQDVTLNASNDVFTWTTLDSASKLQVATTATNSLGLNIVLDQLTFFGDSLATGEAAQLKGIFGLSREKTLVSFELFMGNESDGSTGKTVSGQGYITGLAPTVSADSPVWISPLTITVTGDYTVV